MLRLLASVRCKRFGIRDAGAQEIQFPYENIDQELRARATKSNLFVICLSIQFSREREKVKRQAV